MTKKQTSLGQLSNAELLSNLEALSTTENNTTLDILLHLSEVEHRKLFLAHGFSSLFAYCIGKLRYSEPAANRRISCARAVALCPELAGLLRSREISLSTLSLAAGLLRSENQEEIISGIKGKSRREVEEFVSSYRPQKEARESIKPLGLFSSIKPEPKPSMPLFEPKEKPQAGILTSPGECAPLSAEMKEPITEQRYELRFCVNRKVMHKLEQAKVLLSGKYRAGVKLEQVLDEALEHFLNKRSPLRRIKRREQRLTKKVKVASLKPVTENTKPSRHIPQELKDKVYQRDQGQCTFVSPEGKRCEEKHCLQYHHILPFALGGKHHLENLALRCACHNHYQAELDYGAEFITSCRKVKSSPPPLCTPTN